MVKTDIIFIFIRNSTWFKYTISSVRHSACMKLINLTKLSPINYSSDKIKRIGVLFTWQYQLSRTLSISNFFLVSTLLNSLNRITVAALTFWVWPPLILNTHGFRNREILHFMLHRCSLPNCVWCSIRSIA